MSGFEHWLAGHDSMTGTLVLLLWTAGVVTALAIVIGVLAFREFAMRDTIAVLLRTAGVLVGAVLVWAWLDSSMLREYAAERRALDARATELTARAIAPGSALACLNAVGNEVVETACEQALFASPQAAAAAVAYVDARLTLLADGLDYAGRNRSYASELDRPRRALEADRFGIVAHVLASRGCTADDCAAFKLMQDTTRVQANLKERLFAARVAQYAANWPASAVATASAANPAPATTPPSWAPGAPVASKFSFPSSASIPPVSIMSPEPADNAPASNASGATAAPPAAGRQTQPARRQSADRASSGQGAPPVRLPPPPAVPPQGSSPSQR
jgi:hypothetical protein